MDILKVEEVKIKCFECDKELNKAEIKYNIDNAEYCCDGHDCACMGQPIEPPYCFKCISKGLRAWQKRLSEEKLELFGVVRWGQTESKDWTQELNMLKLKHPNAKVVVMVDENANNGEWSRMSCEDISVNFEQVVIFRDEYCDDEDYIKQELSQELDPSLGDEEIEKETEKIFDSFIKNNPWQDTIFVNVG